MLDTTNWTVYPFEVDGIKFESRVKPASGMAERISQVPLDIFQQMNIGAIRDCVGDVLKFTRSELLAELERVNDGYQEAYLALADES